MSVLRRSSLLFSLVRGLKRHQRFPFIEPLNQCKTAQLLAQRGRNFHSWKEKHFACCEEKYPWTTHQRKLCTEEPSKIGEYPPLPDYKVGAEESQDKEVFLVQAKGLPYTSTAEDIINFFSECKVRGGVQGIHIMHNQFGRPTGQAIIELEHELDVGKALDQHRHYLGHRFIEVYEVTNKDAEAILKATKPLEISGVVRLKGLPFSCTEEDIIQFFSGLEIVENGVTIVLNKRGKNSGDAFVEFATNEMAGQALKKDREFLGNRYVEILPSSKSAIQPQYGRWREESPAFTARADDVPLRNKTVPKIFIHMRGLPFGTRAEDIVKFFAPIRLMRILLEYRADGKPTGEAEAYFSTHQDAVFAMSKDREYIRDRYIELYLNSNTSSDVD